jgi:hypothetical protein
VDQELREINSFIQSSDDAEFRLGLQKLGDRVHASEKADSNLTRLGGSALKEERVRWQESVRKARKADSHTYLLFFPLWEQIAWELTQEPL